MADREVWLKMLALAGSSRQAAGNEPCPDCGQYQLELRYIVDVNSRIGYVLFWCGSCLHGISVSRARAPEGLGVWPIDDPESIVGVPNFMRHN